MDPSGYTRQDSSRAKKQLRRLCLQQARGFEIRANNHTKRYRFSARTQIASDSFVLLPRCRRGSTHTKPGWLLTSSVGSLARCSFGVHGAIELVQELSDLSGDGINVMLNIRQVAADLQASRGRLLQKDLQITLVRDDVAQLGNGHS